MAAAPDAASLIGSRPKPSPRLPASPAERFFVQRVTDRVRPGTSVASRWPVERGMYENILMYQGHQWLDYDPAGRRFVPQNLPAWFPMPVDNQIKPRADQLMAQIGKRKPDARVRANTTEPTDVGAARDGDFVLAHIDDVVGEEALRQLAAATAVLCGTVASIEWFDPEAGEEVTLPRLGVKYSEQTRDVATCPTCAADYPPEGVGMPCPDCQDEAGLTTPLEPATRPVVGPDGQPMMASELVNETDAQGQPVVDRFHTGEVRSQIVLPFELYADELATDPTQCRWMARVTYQPLEWIRNAYPARAQFVTEESGGGVYTHYRTALLSMSAQAADHGLFSQASSLLSGGAIFVEYEELPTREFPQGLTIIVANDVLLFLGPLRIPGEFSMSIFRYDIVPGYFWGATPVSQLIHHQRIINAIRSQIIINRKTMLSPWILAPTACGLVAGNVFMRPGCVIPYIWNGLGAAPQVVPGQALPTQIIDEWRMTLQSMDRIAATEEVQMGSATDGATSGVMIHQLAEAAETRHLPRSRRWEGWIADRGHKRLELAQRYYEEARLMKLIGAGSSYQVRRLRGADLRGNTDVTVEAGSSLPRSRAQQLQLMLDLAQLGVLRIEDESVRAKIVQEAGLRVVEPDEGEDRRRAEVENAMLANGILPYQFAPYQGINQLTLPTVGRFENHLLHLDVHLPQVRDPRFDALPLPAKQAFLRHIEEHRLAEALEQAKEISAPGGLMSGAESAEAPAGGPSGAAGKPGATPPAPRPGVAPPSEVRQKAAA